MDGINDGASPRTEPRARPYRGETGLGAQDDIPAGNLAVEQGTDEIFGGTGTECGGGVQKIAPGIEQGVQLADCFTFVRVATPGERSEPDFAHDKTTSTHCAFPHNVKTSATARGDASGVRLSCPPWVFLKQSFWEFSKE